MAAIVIGLCVVGPMLPPSVDAAFECRIKKSLRGTKDHSIKCVGSGCYNFQYDRGDASAQQIYATVASTTCTDDAAMISSRAATAGELGCSTQTNLPAETAPNINPSVSLTFETLGTNLLDGEGDRAPTLPLS